MSKSKILHVFNDQKKFSESYFDFLAENGFSLEEHTLFHYGKEDKSYKRFNMPFIFSSIFSVINNIKLLSLMFSHEKIIAHSLVSPWLLLYLYLFPKLNKKLYWVIWGKDLYYYRLLNEINIFHKIYECFRKNAFKNAGYIVTHVRGDYELAKQWYGSNAVYYECFMYPSNLYKEHKLPKKENTAINIQIGNSADPSNNHIEILGKLEKYKDRNIVLTVPLSYGDKKYAQQVIKKGREIFGDKIKPLTKFIPYDKYLVQLAEIDIAIFNHERQQAMGNIITLLGLGKKVYMRNDITSWSVFNGIGVKVFDVADVSILVLDSVVSELNKKRIGVYFSEKKLSLQLHKLFES